MTTDQKNGAGAYKADREATTHVESGQKRRDFRAPFHLNLSKDRTVTLDYRQVAAAAGALGLGFLAFKGVRRAIGKGVQTNAIAAGHSGHVDAEPLVPSPNSTIKDNNAPRFNSEGSPNRIDEPPFVATSKQDDTADLAIGGSAQSAVPGSVGTDRSAATAEHVPTDLMGDQPPTANDRAIDAFRPDPTAPVPEAMRDSLRPATGPAPSLAADRGTFGQGLSQTDGSK